MTKQALTALNKSVEHWQRMADGKARIGEEPNGENCALCQSLDKELQVFDCLGCPVQKATGLDFCEGSPWQKASLAFGNHGLSSPQFRAAAKLELAFLKGLLPKKGKKGA